MNRVGRMRRIWDNVTDTMDPKRYAIIGAVGLGVFVLHRMVSRNVLEIRQIRRTRKPSSTELQQASAEVQNKVRVATSLRDVKLPLVRGVQEYDLQDTGVINLPSESRAPAPNEEAVRLTRRWKNDTARFQGWKAPRLPDGHDCDRQAERGGREPGSESPGCGRLDEQVGAGMEAGELGTQAGFLGADLRLVRTSCRGSQRGEEVEHIAYALHLRQRLLDTWMRCDCHRGE